MPPAVIVVQALFNFRKSIAFHAGDNVRRLKQFSVPDGGGLDFGICNVGQFRSARVKQIVIHLVSFLPVNRLPDLSAAVMTLHAVHL